MLPSPYPMKVPAMNKPFKLLNALPPLFLVLSLAFIFMTSLWQPMAADDYDIQYSYLQSGSVVGHVAKWYYSWSGRALGYAIGGFALSGNVQRTIFQGASAILFFALAYLSCRLCQKEKISLIPADLFRYTLMLSLLWFCLPIIGQTVFWTSGALVYLWPAFFVLAAILFVLRPFLLGEKEETQSPLSLAASFFLGSVIGNFQEQAALSLFAFLVIASVIPGIRKNVSFFGKIVPASIGLFTGFLILILAPGNAERQHMVDGLTLEETLFRLTRFLSKVFNQEMLLFILIIALLRICLDLFEREKGEEKNATSLLWLCLATASALPILFFPKFEQPRTAFYSVLFLILLLFTALMGKRKAIAAFLEKYPAVYVLAALPLLASTSHAALMARKLHLQETERGKLVERAMKAGSAVIFAPRPDIYSYKVFVWDLSTNPRSMYNKMYSEIKGISSVKVDMALVEDPDFEKSNM